MTLAQLLPQAKFLVVTTPQPAAQSVARRAADMAGKVDLEVLGVIENMSGFTTPDGQRFTIFGEGGGQLLADELDVPLLGKVPLSEPLREHADNGTPLVLAEPDSPASVAIRQAARGIVAMTPQELPVMQAETPSAPALARSAAPSFRSSRSRDSRRRGGPAARSEPHLVDERVPIHVGSAFYDVDGFRAGGSTLRPFELDEAATSPASALPTCSATSGSNTLSWARPGASVAGLDFSGPAIEAASGLAAETGSMRASSRPTSTTRSSARGRPFDIVYTGSAPSTGFPTSALGRGGRPRC